MKFALQEGCQQAASTAALIPLTPSAYTVPPHTLSEWLAGECDEG